MKITNPEDYTLKGFERSNTKNKKYDAILENKETKTVKRIPFGDTRYEHYKDVTPLKLYTHLNHYDEKRRSNYLKRHANDKDNKYSSGFFSANFLW